MRLQHLPSGHDGQREVHSEYMTLMVSPRELMIYSSLLSAHDTFAPVHRADHDFAGADVHAQPCRSQEFV